MPKAVLCLCLSVTAQDEQFTTQPPELRFVNTLAASLASLECFRYDREALVGLAPLEV
jgi:hypothetical protein